jgi:hypothetical protein
MPDPRATDTNEGQIPKRGSAMNPENLALQSELNRMASVYVEVLDFTPAVKHCSRCGQPSEIVTRYVLAEFRGKEIAAECCADCAKAMEGDR